jgi:hypothetical protein
VVAGGSLSAPITKNNIAEGVCYERIKKVIGGNPGFESSKELLFETKLNLKALNNIESTFDQIEEIKETHDGLFKKIEVKVEDGFLRVFGSHENVDSTRRSNLKYFTTDFVPNILTDNDKRFLVSRSTELLCIAEDTFEELFTSTGKNEYSIFTNSKRSTAIIYDEDAIADCIDKLHQLKPNGTTIIYVFSYDQDFDQEDFAELEIKFRIKPIPEAILNVYRRNAKLRRK